MGNHTSSRNNRNGTEHALRRCRNRNSLGISSSELEKRCKPSGLYPSWEWEQKAIRRLIGEGKLAARLNGTDNRLTPSSCECPICFLNYTQVNTTTCCGATVCTECYLQIRPQKERHVTCPFCNHVKIQVRLAKTTDNVEENEKRDIDEQKAIEANIRSRTKNTLKDKEDIVGEGTPSAGGFGANLERRMRSRSLSTDLSSEAPVDNTGSLVVSPDERRTLEQEVRAQSAHPLSLSMAQEAEEERNRHETEHFDRTLERLRNSGYERDLMLMRAYGIGIDRGRSINSVRSPSLLRRSSLDDTNRSSSGDPTVLEAALMLSLEEERQRRQTSVSGSDNDLDGDESPVAGLDLLMSLIAQQQRVQTGDQDDNEGTERGGEGTNDQLPNNQHNTLLAQRSQNVSSGILSSGILMGTFSEEDQVALAIANSLRDAESESQTDHTNGSSPSNVAQSPLAGVNEHSQPSDSVE